jgi:hypothetical protein
VTDPGQALKRLLAALDECGIACFIGGSLASGIHGIYRTTMDVDIVADIHPPHVATLARRLSGEFYADADMMREALQAGRSFTVIHLGSSFKFDIFPMSSDPHDQAQFARRSMSEVSLGGEILAVPVASAEDTLLNKLVWYRSGGETSERQWNDVRGIVAIQGERLDRTYLRRWAAHLKVADLLEAALAA